MRAFICCLYAWEQEGNCSNTLGKTQSNGREKINIAQGNAGETNTLTRGE